MSTNTDDAPLVLPGEGEVRVTTEKRVRRECDFCDEFATMRNTFLLPDARRNPASTGYGKDDISWCSDAEQFACEAHSREGTQRDGYRVCSTFEVSAGLAHLFLTWQKVTP